MLQIEQILADATQNIDSHYFQLPVVNKESLLYRERVYCYELYHQIRLRWPSTTEYMLCGEIDKSGHPLVRGNELDQVKPDFIIHIPSKMDANHSVIEVKPVNAKINGIKKDLSILNAFIQKANYSKAYYLFYGTGNIDRIKQIIESIIINENGAMEKIGSVNFWWHKQVGVPADVFMQPYA